MHLAAALPGSWYFCAYGVPMYDSALATNRCRRSALNAAGRGLADRLHSDVADRLATTVLRLLVRLASAP